MYPFRLKKQHSKSCPITCILVTNKIRRSKITFVLKIVITVKRYSLKLLDESDQDHQLILLELLTNKT